MNIEKIEINGHYVWVDIHNKDFEKGRFGLYKKYKIGVITDVNDDILEFEGEYIDEEHCYKIIAASPELNLEGVPTYFEWLFENQKIELDGGNLIQVIKDVFIKGYQTAEKELPTWDDVRKAIELAQTVKDYGDYKPYTEEQIIKQLKQSKK